MTAIRQDSRFHPHPTKRDACFTGVSTTVLSDTDTPRTVFAYLDSQARRLYSMGHIRSSETLRSTLRSFMHFRAYVDMPLEALDKDTICLYETYLRGRGLLRNTTSFYMRNLRTAYHAAVEEGLTADHKPFRKVYTGVDKTAKRAIGIDDIRRIRQLPLQSRPALSFARDMALFSFYTRGMSFVDMAYLRKRDVVDGYIIYRRKKTGQTLMVEMEPEMAAIIARYPTDTPYLLPLISEAGDTGRRQYRNQLMRVNRNLKPIGHMASLPIPLSMYVMRHAWATIARDKGFSLSVISKGLGHDNEATTRIYLNSLRASQIDDANRIILDDLKTSTNKD